MGFQGLPTQLARFLFSAGLNQKADPRAAQMPSLDIAQNVEADHDGAMNTRKPFSDVLSTLDIDGNDITDTGEIRQLAENGDEKLLFTETALFSYVESKAAWANRGTHLAVTTDENEVFAQNGEQANVERVEFGSVVLWAWIQATSIYVAASDKTTGATILPPTLADTSGHGADTLRLIGLSTRVLLVWRDTSVTKVKAIAIDPANLAASIVLATDLTGILSVQRIDALRIPNTDTALIALGETSTQYQLLKVTSALAITTVTKARGADNAIAIAIDPGATWVQVARITSTTSTAIVGDKLLLSTLADVTVNQAIGARSVNNGVNANAHVTCEYRSGAPARCYVFWTDSDLGSYKGTTIAPTALNSFQLYANWVDTAGTIGVTVTLTRDVAPAARAFAYDGAVYLWTSFAGPIPTHAELANAELQDTFFLYRHDGFLAAKACANIAGGHHVADPFSHVARALPAVQLVTGTTGFRVGLTARRLVPVGGFGFGFTKPYSGRTPVDVTFTFDDNRARRCVRLGRTLYIAGSPILQYDGVSLTEVGFAPFAWAQLISQATTGGSVGTGTFAYKNTLKCANATGEVERSTTATVSEVTTTTATSKVTALLKPAFTTRKRNINIELWRTEVDPIDVSPFFLVSALDPNTTSGDNAYVANDPTVVQITETDVLIDAAIESNQANPENGTVLENLPPPAATIIVANDTRVFLAGVSGLPNVIWYSKTRNDGEVVAFNDALTVQVPTEGGVIKALAYFNETLVAFCETAVYAFPGTGFDNAAGGQNFGPSRRVCPDCGALSQETVAEIDSGIVFKSKRGWYHLDRGWATTYIGSQVSGFDSDDTYAIHVQTKKHQMRVLTDRRILVFDSRITQWFEWTELAVAAAMWGDVHVITDGTTARMQRSDFTGVTYGWDLEFVWWKPADLQGRGIVREIQLLGEYEGPHSVRVRLANDYKSDGAGGWLYNYDKTWTVSPTVVGGPERLSIAPKYKRLEALKVRLTALAADKVSAPNSDTAILTGIAFAYAVEGELNQALPAAQRQ